MLVHSFHNFLLNFPKRIFYTLYSLPYVLYSVHIQIPVNVSLLLRCLFTDVLIDSSQRWDTTWKNRPLYEFSLDRSWDFSRGTRKPSLNGSLDLTWRKTGSKYTSIPEGPTATSRNLSRVVTICHENYDVSEGVGHQVYSGHVK